MHTVCKTGGRLQRRCCTVMFPACLQRRFGTTCSVGLEENVVIEWYFSPCNRTIVPVCVAFGGVWGGIRGLTWSFSVIFFQDKAKGHSLAGFSPFFSCCPFLCGSRTVSQSFCAPCPSYCRSQLSTRACPAQKCQSLAETSPLWPSDELQELCRLIDLRIKREDWKIKLTDNSDNRSGSFAKRWNVLMWH